MLVRLSQLPRWLRDFVPLLGWMALIFWLSSQSDLVDLDNQAEERLLYKTSHMIAYGTLVWLWWRALAPQRQLTWSNLSMALAFTVLYGISDEIHQLYVPDRHGRVADVLFDTAGALAMILLIRRVKWLRDFPETISIFSPNRDNKSPQF